MIDWPRICELRDEIGNADFEDVMRLFFEEFEEALATIQSLSDAHAVAAAVHFLKGSALNIGFEQVSTLCSALESSGTEKLSRDTEIQIIASAYHESKSAYFDEFEVERAL